jgi:hypothetical protein
MDEVAREMVAVCLNQQQGSPGVMNGRKPAILRYPN